MSASHLLKTYQKRLTNLTAKNRSLLLLRLSGGQSMDLHALDHVLESASFNIIEKLLAQKKAFRIAPLLDSRDTHANLGSALLRRLYRSDRFVQEEQGAFDMHVGYPMVQGKMTDGTLVRAPLLLFPVTLALEEGFWVLGLRDDAGIAFNRSFLLAFSHYNETLIGDALLEEDFSDFPKEALPFLTMLYRKLEQSPLEINFNQQTFEERLHPFREFQKQEFEQATEIGMLKAYPEAVLGLFPQAASQLEPDYAFLLQKNDFQEVENFFLPKHRQKLDASLRAILEAKAAEEESLMAPYPLDASQERALHAVKAGHSIVVQGPPGSGKSQLICNLIADAIGQGKNVLVVCQKKAALDVVYKRLEEKELSDFVGLVHDFRNDRSALYKQLNRNIERIEEFKLMNNSLDAIYLERSFIKHSRTIDQVAEELELFRKALFDTSECGISAKELYLLADPVLPHIKLRREYEHYPAADASEFIRRLQSYAWYGQRFEYTSHLWEERHSFSYFGIADLPTIEQAVNDVQAFSANKAWEIAEILPLEVSLDDCAWIDKNSYHLRRLAGLLNHESIHRNFRYFLLHPQASYAWLAARQRGVMASFGPEGLEQVLERRQLGHTSQVLQEAIEAKESWFQWLQWRLFSKEKAFIKDLVSKNNLEWHPNSLPILLKKVENRMNLEHYLAEMRGAGWLPDVPQLLEAEALNVWFEHCLTALEAKDLYEGLRTEFPRLRIEELPVASLAQQVEKLLQAVYEVPSRRRDWERYLSSKQIQELEEGRVSPNALIKALDADFDALCEFDRLKDGLKPFEQEILDKLYETVGRWDGPQMARIFENSVRTAWINHIEAKYPILRSVASNRLEQLEAEMKASIAAKQGICKQMVLLRVRERLYKDVEYNRLNNMVTYREVKHQVAKKRNIWPLRKLIANHAREVLSLMPCWMASPESASAIFQMERAFDLVIFDEASQCFAERGLPAMYRGQQVVVVGDSQQLAPYELYQPRWEEETDDVALEIDSLLDLACQFLPQHLLSGHYRSESLALIDFSNRHFYEGRLRMLPTKENLLHAAPAIQYHKVEGVWEKQRNEAEADKVIEVMKTLLEQGEKSFCAIAFNFLQQELILDKMEQAGIAWPTTVFVKNIENVQGDERDIVIFSIGYAPSKDGKMRFQFGSLGLQKGENRLNVAITRARKRIVLVSSIWPHQLHVEESKHEGPRLLKEYLQYAHEVSQGNFSSQLSVSSTVVTTALLRNRIYQHAPALTEGFPFADLANLSPEKAMLILTDDERFHQALSVKEIYGYMPMLLASKEWPFLRFYSRNYWKQRPEFEAQISELY